MRGVGAGIIRDLFGSGADRSQRPFLICIQRKLVVGLLILSGVRIVVSKPFRIILDVLIPGHLILILIRIFILVFGSSGLCGFIGLGGVRFGGSFESSRTLAVCASTPTS